VRPTLLSLSARTAPLSFGEQYAALLHAQLGLLQLCGNLARLHGRDEDSARTAPELFGHRENETGWS
jgi:hypothetical protein